MLRAPLKISEPAADQIKEILCGRDDAFGVRLGVRTRECDVVLFFLVVVFFFGTVPPPPPSPNRRPPGLKTYFLSLFLLSFGLSLYGHSPPFSLRGTPPPPPSARPPDSRAPTITNLARSPSALPPTHTSSHIRRLQRALIHAELCRPARTDGRDRGGARRQDMHRAQGAVPYRRDDHGLGGDCDPVAVCVSQPERYRGLWVRGELFDGRRTAAGHARDVCSRRGRDVAERAECGERDDMRRRVPTRLDAQ